MVFAIDEDLEASPFVVLLDSAIKRIGGDIESVNTHLPFIKFLY